MLFELRKKQKNEVPEMLGITLKIWGISHLFSATELFGKISPSLRKAISLVPRMEEYGHDAGIIYPADARPDDDTKIVILLEITHPFQEGGTIILSVPDMAQAVKNVLKEYCPRNEVRCNRMDRVLFTP